MSSYEKINYSLRPAKHIERKMMAEVFRHLPSFGDIASYRYIGFGSIYFSDFYLFHKILGINDMVSIEKDEHNEKRFLFNRPFKCIDVKFGSSLEVLPKMTWEQRSIIWLDYDGTISKDVLADVEYLSSSVAMGSIIIVTLNAQPERVEKDDPVDRAVDLLKTKVGDNNVPTDITGHSLRKWGTALAYRRIIHNKVMEAIANKNGGRTHSNKINYKQLFHFNYKDGAQMLTVGGIIYDEGQKQLFNVDFLKDKFDFLMTEDTPYEIHVPNLTYREIRHLDSLLPGDLSDTDINIPLEDLSSYKTIYRYFPVFAESEH